MEKNRVLRIASLLALLAGLGWLGLRVRPGPFPPHPERTPELDTAELPDDLPEPVRRYFETTIGRRIPGIETAVVWGRGYFNLNGLVWFPMRFKAYYDSGRAFRRDMELAWFGVPVFRGSDTYLDGRGALEITGLLDVSGSGENFDQGQNLVMWAEALFTTPSVLVLDPRVRWEPVDAHTARLVVPFGDREERLTVAFEPMTGMAEGVYGLRYRNREKTRTLWCGECAEWRTSHGMELPHRNTAAWDDMKGPYAVLEVEGSEYNVDVSGKVPESGSGGG